MKSTIRIRAFQGGKQALQADFFEAAFVAISRKHSEKIVFHYVRMLVEDVREYSLTPTYTFV